MSRGFTILELMITIAIMAIVAALGMPGFLSTIENNRARSAANDFFSTIIKARSEAIKRNQPVVLCKSSDGSSCAASGGWEQGWIGFVSTDSVLDAGEDIFVINLSLPLSASLRAVNGSDKTLSFLSDGSLGFSETFNVCIGTDTTRGRSIDLSVTGRPSRDKEATQCP